eukprot:736066-Rhodomonas_salina.3
MNAIAEAAKKRAAKLGIENQEVDATNVGSGPDPNLAHPFFGKLRQSVGGDLSPRSKRLKELEDSEGGGGGGGGAEKKPAPAPAAPAPPAPPGPPAPAPPPPAPAAPAAPVAGDSAICQRASCEIHNIDMAHDC